MGTKTFNGDTKTMSIKTDFPKTSKDMMRGLGTQLHSYLDDPGLTFQRDSMLFIYGRFMILNLLVQEESNHTDAFTMDASAYHLGSAIASMTQQVYEMGEEELKLVGRDTLSVTLAEMNKRMMDSFNEGYNDKVKLLTTEPTDSTTVQ